MIRRLARGVGYWWAVVCFLLIPPRLRKVSPRHDPVPVGPDIPEEDIHASLADFWAIGRTDHPNCRCALVPAEPVAHCPDCGHSLFSEAEVREHEVRHRVQRLIVRPMVQRGEVIRGGDPATGKVGMWLTEKGADDLT